MLMYRREIGREWCLASASLSDEPPRTLLSRSPTIAFTRGEAEREPARALGVGDHADREVGIFLEALDDGPRVGRLHHAVDGLAPSVGRLIDEDGHLD